MINITLLHAFLEVAKAGSLTLAAHALQLTQPALSHRIKQLEGEIGGSLFLRKKSGMELNEIGRTFFDLCKRLSHDVEDVDRWIKNRHGRVEGRLRITTVSSVINYVLPGFLESFTQRYPDARFTIEEHVSAVSEELVLNGSHDVGIIADSGRKNSLKGKLLFKNNRLIMVCSPRYAKKHHPTISAHTLQPHEILWYVNSRSRGAKKIARQLGLPYLNSIGRIALADMETCKIYARNGLGVAVVAHMFVADELKRGQLMIIPGRQINVPLYMISRNEPHPSPLLEKFKEEFAAYCLKKDSQLK